MFIQNHFKDNFNHLNPFLPNLISSNHGGFVEKRQMVDNIMLVQEEFIQVRPRESKEWPSKLTWKIPLNKVRHSFLLVVLTRFGFNEEFISWVAACIHNPWIAPLVNGRPTPFFKISRGLRQGFPLSPSYIF
jgi:hypothetical protein